MRPWRAPGLASVADWAFIGLAGSGLLFSRRVWAADGPGDVETDHIDAFDDLGPRTAGVFCGPDAVGVASSRVGLGAEVDFVLGDVAAVSIGGFWLPFAQDAYRVSVGMPIFAWAVPFHGLYLHPRVTLDHRGAAGGSLHIAGVGMTVGWERTWRPGFTMRIGSGVAYERTLGDDADAVAAGIEPVFDGSVGWAF
jgi:hypothetical protein